MKKLLVSVFVSLFVFSSYIHAEDEAVIAAMSEYMDFAAYGDGTITKSQMQALGLENLHIIDARSADRFENSHIDNAVNIEWRQVLNNLDSIPKEQTVVLYCDSGLLSSKAHFALRLAGYENVRVLLGGYAAWQSK